jgi:hypothetical protein
MKVVSNVLLAAAWLGIACPAAALAQTQPVQAQAPSQECNALCRLFGGGSSNVPAEPAATEMQQDQPQHRRRYRKPRATAVPEPSRAASTHGIRIVEPENGAHAAIDSDLAAVLGPALRVETVASKGAVLKDLLTLPDVDMALVSALSLSRGSDLSDRLVYLAKMFTEELHAVATVDVRSVEDLNGKPVYLGYPGSDAEIAAQALLEARGVKVEPVSGTLDDALAGLKEKRVAAVFVLAPKPFSQLSALSDADGLRLLPLPYKTSDEAFYPASLASADYPALVPDGGQVETVALDTVLVAPRWRDSSHRQQELTAFSRRLFEQFPELLAEGRHPKWKETNLATALEGPRRLRAAQEWVAAKLKEHGKLGQAPSGSRRRVGEVQ